MGDLFTPVHLIIVLGIALLVFGPKRLPELGAGLGKSLREFREATSGMTGAFSTENLLPKEMPRAYVRPATPTAMESTSPVGPMPDPNVDTGG